MSLRTRLNIHHPLLTGPGNNLWKSARIFCKIAIKGCRNLQTLHSIPSSYFSIPCSPFPRVFFLRFDFIRLTPSVLRETLSRYPSSQHSASSDIPCFFTLPLPEFPSFSSTPVVPFSTLFFPLLSFILSSSFFQNTLHFSLPRFTLPPQCSRFERFLQPSISRISDHFYSLTHIPVSLTGVLLLGRQIYRRVYWGCARVKCHRSKFLVCRRAKVSREYRIRDEDQPSWFIFRVGVIRRPPP